LPKVAPTKNMKRLIKRANQTMSSWQVVY